MCFIAKHAQWMKGVAIVLMNPLGTIRTSPEGISDLPPSPVSPEINRRLQMLSGSFHRSNVTIVRAKVVDMIIPTPGRRRL